VTTTSDSIIGRKRLLLVGGIFGSINGLIQIVAFSRIISMRAFDFTLSSREILTSLTSTSTQTIWMLLWGVVLVGHILVIAFWLSLFNILRGTNYGLAPFGTVIAIVSEIFYLMTVGLSGR